jgi:hypothetical protein
MMTAMQAADKLAERPGAYCGGRGVGAMRVENFTLRVGKRTT